MLLPSLYYNTPTCFCLYKCKILSTFGKHSIFQSISELRCHYLDYKLRQRHHTHKTAGLLIEAEGPFQRSILHPFRCALHFAGEHVKAAADAHQNFGVQLRAVCHQPFFLLRCAQSISAPLALMSAIICGTSSSLK